MELESNKYSIVYHDVFNYPLTSAELVRWKVGKKFLISNKKYKLDRYEDFYFLKGRKKIVSTRLQNNKYSKSKIVISHKVAKILSFIPYIKFVGITGSLAMNNASNKSDIDLLIITKHNKLWLTRFLTYFILITTNQTLRKPKDKNEKDALCLNMWLDEKDLVWDKKDQNIYTSHEIAQIVPLLNKDKTYQRFLYLNKWVLDYWPNAVSIKKIKIYKFEDKLNVSTIFSQFVEKIFFLMQYLYMKNKITKEIVKPTRAFFHTKNWSNHFFSKLSS